jgi:hypothetical protein
VTGHRQILVIYRRSAMSYPDRMPAGDGAMTGMPTAGDRAAGAARQGPIGRRDLVATLNRAARKR